jgi:transcriptional regulator with XRE-family HTH domain
MIELKLIELRQRTTQRELAEATGITITQLRNILKGRSGTTPDTARRLAFNACRLTQLSIYEPHDFCESMNPALKNLCDDVRFRVTHLDTRDDQIGTVVELLGDDTDDLEMLQAMHECVWDGARRLIHHPDRLIELED